VQYSDPSSFDAVLHVRYLTHTMHDIACNTLTYTLSHRTL
jgi:hypothetical protein